MTRAADYERPPGDALATRERAVITLWDANLSIEQIARKLSLGRRTVQQIVTQLAQTETDRLDRQAIAAGSAALLGAMKAAGMGPLREGTAA